MKNCIKKIKQILQRISFKLAYSPAHLLTCSLFLSTLLSLPAYSYEDCLVTTNGKMTEIRIEDHEIIDVS